MDLQDWNAALLERVRADAVDGRRVYLYVDRDVLADIAGIDDPDRAAKDFCDAFQSVVEREPFKRSYQQGTAWRKSGWKGEPPIVAALAMTVLAVTDDPLGGSHGVYRQQNQLLGLPAEARQPPGYDFHVPALWRMWNEWLVGSGSWLGKPSAHTHPRLVNQGWARSQGLIRFRDRLLLDAYFDSVRLDTVAQPTPDRLAAEFLTWLAYRDDHANRLLARLQDDAAREILVAVIEDEAQRWDGTGRHRGSHTAGTIQGQLFYDAWDDYFDIAIEVDQRVTEQPVDLGDREEDVSATEPTRVLNTGYSAARLLSQSCTWTLRPGLTVRTVPHPAYVFREEPMIGGLLQVRGAATAAQYSLLIDNSHLDRVREVVGNTPTSAQARPGPEGWTWLSGVRPPPDADSALRALGLGLLATPAPGRMHLEGGLRLSTSTYLTGGEPNLVLPDECVVEFSDTLFTAQNTQRVVLADQYPDPGDHEIRDVASGETLRFRSVAFVRSRAEGASARWDLTGRPQLLLNDGSAGGAITRLSGARLDGAPGPSALTSQLLPGHCALVLDEQGDLHEVAPPTERWLRRAGLGTGNVDVLRAVRSMSPRPAFFLTYSARTGAISAVEVPEATFLMPGSVNKRPRPDLISATFTAWKWVGASNERRKSEVLSRALRPSSAPRLAPTGSLADARPTVANRRDTVEQVARNPYDDALTWLSEQERSQVSVPRFAEAWGWLCARFGATDLGAEWRPALERLRLLGHIERDFIGRQIHAAAPALIPLPSAEGLMLLTGARPGRVLERLDDPDDENTTVSAAAASYLIHRRTQLDPESRVPLGPTALYFEVQPERLPNVAAGLDELGVQMLTCCPADGLLNLLPSLEDEKRAGQRLVLSPSSRIAHWGRPQGQGPPGWQLCESDRGAGLYRYRTSYGTRFAWRGSHADQLILTDPHSGRWLEEARLGRLERVSFDQIKRTLLMPETLGLPHLLQRALVLRTGLLPRRVPPIPVDGLRQHPHLAFENVDASAARRVASLLGQTLRDVNTPPEEDT